MAVPAGIDIFNRYSKYNKVLQNEKWRYDFTILLNFLKSGFSTRKLDKLMGYSHTKGWQSWEILKKYNLRDEDKGKLFLYSEQQSKKIIDELKRDPKEGILGVLISATPPNNLEKYKNTFVIAESEKDFYNIFFQAKRET